MSDLEKNQRTETGLNNPRVLIGLAFLVLAFWLYCKSTTHPVRDQMAPILAQLRGYKEYVEPVVREEGRKRPELRVHYERFRVAQATAIEFWSHINQVDNPSLKGQEKVMSQLDNCYRQFERALFGGREPVGQLPIPQGPLDKFVAREKQMRDEMVANLNALRLEPWDNLVGKEK